MPNYKGLIKGALSAIKGEQGAANAEGRIASVLESRTPPMTTPMGTGLPLLPRSSGMYTPGVPQVDLPRMPLVDKARQANKSPKYTERMQDLLDSPTARKKVNELISKGEELGMREWYGTEPLRQAALDLGMSEEKYREFMAQLASASQRNPVDKQNQMGSYLWHLSQTGQLPEDAFLLTNAMKKGKKPTPQGTPVEFPPGYGSLAQSAILDRGKQIAHEGADAALPPERKLGTFYRNLLGNLQPVTVDVNAVRGPVIARGDPRWLTSKLVEKDEEGKVIAEHFPRQAVESGEMTLKEAKDRPGFWEAAPSGSEYAGFEDLWQRAAKRHDIAPAEAQALGWYGSADITALKTKPELYVENIERLIKRTADTTGKSQQEVLSDMLTGKGFLYKDGGSIGKKSLEDMIQNGDPISVQDFVAMHVEPKYAVGGGVTNTNDTRPDITDGGGMIPAPFYARGGQIKLKHKSLKNIRRFDGGGAAFGVFPHLKGRRTKQDPEASKNVPVDVARGFVSGTLGAPGDIESMVRMIPGLERSPSMSDLVTGEGRKTWLPTSEEIERNLPFRSDAPVSKAATGAGQLAGGFYTGPGSGLRIATSVPKAIAKGARDFVFDPSQVRSKFAKFNPEDIASSDITKALGGSIKLKHKSLKREG